MFPKLFKMHLVLVLVLAASPCRADVFFWKDGHGNTHYTDRAHHGATRLKLPPSHTWLKHKKILDGDTFVLAGGEKVRLLAINAPEVERFDKPGEPLGKAAKNYLRTLLDGKKVRLEFDQEKRDKYHRKLAHVFTEQGVHVNLKLLEKGLAAINMHPPNLAYTDRLFAAQRSAEAAKRGIWGHYYYQSKPIDAIGKRHARRWSRLTGIPRRIKKGRRYDRLIFSDRFDIRIHHDNLHYFDDLRKYLMTNLEIRGWVSKNHGRFSMLVRHPSALIRQ